MKSFRYLIVAIFCSAVFTACNKDKEVDATYNIEGTWSGKLGENKKVPDGAFVIIIKPGNVIERINTAGEISGTGPWAIAGNKFTGSYTASNGIRVDIKADLHTSEDKLSGSWSNTVGRSGNFHTVKKLN